MTEEIKKCKVCGMMPFVEKSTNSSGKIIYRVRHSCKMNWHTLKSQAIGEWNKINSVDENPPLTLDELLKMEGQPIYIKNGIDETNPIYKHEEWQIAGGLHRCSEHHFVTYEHATFFISDYGKTWVAYRRKPEEDN